MPRIGSFKPTERDLVKFNKIRTLGRMQKNVRYWKFNETPYRLDKDQVAGDMLQHEPTVGVVRVTQKNYLKALEGFDHDIKKPGDDNLRWRLAKEYTYHMLSMHIPKRKPQYSDLYMHYNTGAGLPFNLYVETKGDIPPSWLEEDFYGEFEEYFWHLAMKREKLDLIKIMEKDKMRSFMMPCSSYLMHQKVYSQAFNEDLKKVPWSAYGFNWHCGGFDKLIRPLSELQYKNDYDIAYWDKAFPLKQECYDLRRRFLDLTEDEEQIYWRVADEEINPKIVLPTGEVIQMESGQCSGSENTTADNTIAHFMIIMYEAITGYLEKYGKIPTLENILQGIIPRIYSDDNISAYDQTFDFMANPQKKHAIFEQFGMAIQYEDPEKWSLSSSIEGHSFLGFTVKNYHGTFVPYYKYSKVKDSTVVRESQEGPNEQITRFKALLELLTFTGYYEEYRNFIIKYSDLFNIDPGFIPTQEYKQIYELGLDLRVEEDGTKI